MSATLNTLSKTIIEPTQKQQVHIYSHAPRSFTVEEYHRMIEAGVFKPTDRVELIDGRILEMSPKGIKHASSNDRSTRCFNRKLGKRVLIRNQNPIHLSDDTEPEPDIVLVAPHKKEYADHHPTPKEIFLVMEIADTTIDFDRNEKSLIYARAGIIQYCVLNVSTRELEDYRGPGKAGYRSKQTFRASQSFSLVAFPSVEIKVKDLLPL